MTDALLDRAYVAALTGPASGPAARLDRAYVATLTESPARANTFRVVAAASSSDNSASFVAANAFNGTAIASAVIDQRWASSSVAAPYWLRADLGSAKVADFYSIVGGGFSSAQDPTAWTFEGSNDATSWTVLDTKSGQTFSGGLVPQLFTFTNTTAYRYYRLNISAIGSGTVASISELAVGKKGDPTAITVVGTVNLDGVTSAPIPVGVAPDRDDDLLVSIISNRTDVTVGGLGATWTEVRDGISSGTGNHSVWRGQGATASGNITISAGAAVQGQATAFVLAGGDVTVMASAGNAADMTAAYPNGALVVSVVNDQNSGTPTLDTSTTTPTYSSWTMTPTFTPTGAPAQRYRAAYRLVDSAAAYSGRWSGLTIAASDQVLIGMPLPSSGAPTAAGAVSMSSTSSLTVAATTTAAAQGAVAMSSGSALSVSGASFTGYAAAVMADSPLVYLRLGETSGTTAADSSGNGRSFTYTNGPTLGVTGLTGDADTAVSFDGVNDYAISTSNTWTPSGSATVEAIIKPTTVAGTQRILAQVPGAGSIAWMLRLDSGKIVFYVRNGGSYIATTGATTLVAGSRYHVAVVSNASGTTIYVNGASDGSSSTAFITSASPGDVTVSGTSEYFSGVIDEAAIYGTALSGARILAHYNAVGAVAAAGAVAMSSSSSLTVAGTVTSAAVQGAVAMSSSSTLSAAGATSAAPAYQAAVLADSPGAYWRLNEADGSVLAYLSDTSGNARRLRVQAAATTLSQPGLISDGTSMRVGVNTSYVQTENSNSWSQVTAGDFTAECWIKILDTAPATSRAILDRANMNWGNDQWSIWWDPANGLRAFMGADSASHVVTWAKASSEAAVQAGGHLVVTRDGATATVRIYWNGTEVASGTGLASPFAVSRVVGIGCDMSGTSRISAYMDEVALYPGIRLSPTRIQAHYEAGAGAQGAASMSSSSTLTVGAEATSVAAVAMSSSSTLTAGASGGAPLAGAVDMQSTSTLAATAVESTQVGAVDMQSTSTMSVTAKATYVEQYRIPLGMTTLAFGRGSALLPYAGAESGSQALDFSIVTEAPASGLFVPQDGPADSRSEWIAITSSASQTLTVTVTAAFSVGIEVWDGDPSVDPLALSLVGSAAASTLDVAVATGQQLLIRVHPMTNATSGTGTVSWSMTARLDSGVLQFYAATEIFETPGWLPANVAAATPGGTLQFTLDSDPTVIYSGIADAQGLWVVSGVLLPALTVGTHSITVTDVSSGQTGTRTFTVATVVPPTGTGVVPPPPTGPTYVQRWYLEDAGGEHYAFPINPSGMSSPHPTRAVIAEHTLSPTGRAILWEGIGDPTLWTITGAVETQAFYEALERFHKMQRRVYLTDHLARIWTVAFESLDLVEQKSAENDWAYTYTAKFLILDGPVTA